MEIYILTFVVLLVVILAMAVGYILQQKTIAGSCGGLGALGIEKACDCDDPCDKRKRRMAAEEARRAKLTKDRII